MRSTHPTQLTQFQSMKQSLEAEEKAEKLAELQAKWERWECAASLQATFQTQMRAKKKSREDQRKGEQVGACCSWTCHRVPLQLLYAHLVDVLYRNDDCMILRRRGR